MSIGQVIASYLSDDIQKQMDEDTDDEEDDDDDAGSDRDEEDKDEACEPERCPVCNVSAVPEEDIMHYLLRKLGLRADDVKHEMLQRRQQFASYKEFFDKLIKL